MYIDVHTHAFHPKIANKAIVHLNNYYNVKCAGSGTIDDLICLEKKANIDKFVILCAATGAAQVIPANNYAIQLQNNYAQVISFGTIHPDFTEWEKELQRLKNNNIKGIKLHPDFQGFWLNDPKLYPILEQAQHDFIFEIHIGDLKPPEKNPSCPYKIASILDAFPKLRLIATHFGGYRHWDHALKSIVGRDIWIETSSSMPFIPQNTLELILKKHPKERILFGSDYPIYDPSEELIKLKERAKLSHGELELILSNATTLFYPS